MLSSPFLLAAVSSLMALRRVTAIENLVVFGDSFSDVGNFQRWTNGPVWSEDVAVGWNTSLYSFAYTGAACDNALFPNISQSDLMPSIRDQMELYYRLDLNLDPENTLFAIWVGVNDIQKTYQQASVNKTTEGLGLVAACIGQQIRNIRRAFHGRKVMVFNVPPLQRMPFFAGSDGTEKWQNAAETLNEMICQDVTKLNEQYTDLKLDLVDVYGLLNDVAADPENFGFKDAETAYLDSPPRSSQADNYVWWDRTHLTSAAHRTIANQILNAGSFSEATRVPDNVQTILSDPRSRYRSPHYPYPPSNTGLVDELALSVPTNAFFEDTERQKTVDDMKYGRYCLGTTLLIVTLLFFALITYMKRMRCKRCTASVGLLEADEAVTAHMRETK
ncbi:hypothetical protein VTP01DRAFT_8188 [Rhizomucor pusillus]|uniref:uncharacterized protein n=1 Tax=Rhizomucor pusillus TaxID=4840 RepID=UPI0037433817